MTTTITTTITSSYWCGTTHEDARTSCTQACPTGHGCIGLGMYCFATDELSCEMTTGSDGDAAATGFISAVPSLSPVAVASVEITDAYPPPPDDDGNVMFPTLSPTVMIEEEEEIISNNDEGGEGEEESVIFPTLTPTTPSSVSFDAFISNNENEEVITATTTAPTIMMTSIETNTIVNTFITSSSSSSSSSSSPVSSSSMAISTNTWSTSSAAGEATWTTWSPPPANENEESSSTSSSSSSSSCNDDMINTIQTKTGSTIETVEYVLTSIRTFIDTKLFIYETPMMEWIPSSIYRFDGFFNGLSIMAREGVADTTLYLGDDNSDGRGTHCYMYGLVNIAAFLAQAMKETIRYDACDENSWDRVGDDLLYPLSNACGQLGQSYQDYHCTDDERHMECSVDLDMTITAVTNARWWGAPGPLTCGPKTVYPQTGYWDFNFVCDDIWANPPKYCTDYVGQKGGGPNNTIPYPNSAGRTDVQGCCWWGRGVIQTSGICNIGKLNYYLGKGAADNGRQSRYPTIDFCKDPEVICSSTEYSELKWIAGFFYWMNEVQQYNKDGWNYITELHKYVDEGMQGDAFINAVSGIVNRGCHNPPCGTGELDGGPERAQNFKNVLDEMKCYFVEVDEGYVHDVHPVTDDGTTTTDISDSGVTNYVDEVPDITTTTTTTTVAATTEATTTVPATTEATTEAMATTAEISSLASDEDETVFNFIPLVQEESTTLTLNDDEFSSSSSLSVAPEAPSMTDIVYGGIPTSDSTITTNATNIGTSVPLSSISVVSGIPQSTTGTNTLPEAGSTLRYVCGLGSMVDESDMSMMPSIDVTFDYDIHNQINISVGDALRDVKESILTDIALKLGCDRIFSGGRSLQSQQQTNFDYILGINSSELDRPVSDGLGCLVTGEIAERSTICTPVIGGFTIFAKVGTSMLLLEETRTILKDTVQQGMNSGQYETDMVAKAIYIGKRQNSAYRDSVPSLTEKTKEFSSSKQDMIWAIVGLSLACLLLVCLLWSSVKRLRNQREYYDDSYENDEEIADEEDFIVRKEERRNQSEFVGEYITGSRIRPLTHIHNRQRQNGTEYPQRNSREGNGMPPQHSSPTPQDDDDSVSFVFSKSQQEHPDYRNAGTSAPTIVTSPDENTMSSVSSQSSRSDVTSCQGSETISVNDSNGESNSFNSHDNHANRYGESCNVKVENPYIIPEGSNADIIPESDCITREERQRRLVLARARAARRNEADL